MRRNHSDHSAAIHSKYFDIAALHQIALTCFYENRNLSSLENMEMTSSHISITLKHGSWASCSIAHETKEERAYQITIPLKAHNKEYIEKAKMFLLHEWGHIFYTMPLLYFTVDKGTEVDSGKALYDALTPVEKEVFNILEDSRMEQAFEGAMKSAFNSSRAAHCEGGLLDKLLASLYRQAPMSFLNFRKLLAGQLQTDAAFEIFAALQWKLAGASYSFAFPKEAKIFVDKIEGLVPEILEVFKQISNPGRTQKDKTMKDIKRYFSLVKTLVKILEEEGYSESLENMSGTISPQQDTGEKQSDSNTSTVNQEQHKRGLSDEANPSNLITIVENFLRDTEANSFLTSQEKVEIKEFEDFINLVIQKSLQETGANIIWVDPSHSKKEQEKRCKIVATKYRNVVDTFRKMFNAGWRAPRRKVKTEQEFGELDLSQLYKARLKGKSRELYQVTHRGEAPGLNLLVLFDISGSISPNQLEAGYNTVTALYQSVRNDPKVHVKIILFTFRSIVVKDWKGSMKFPNLTEIRSIQASTPLQEVLLGQYYEFVEQSGDRMLVVITDGQPDNWSDEVIREYNRIATTLVIGLTGHAEETFHHNLGFKYVASVDSTNPSYIPTILSRELKDVIESMHYPTRSRVLS